MLEKNLPENSKLTFKHTFFEEVSNENWVCHTIDMGPEPEDYKNNFESVKDPLKSPNQLHLMPFNYILSAQKRLSGADNIIELSCGFSTKNEVRMVFSGEDQYFHS